MPRSLQLAGGVQGMCEIALAKKFFLSVNIQQDQVSGPQVPLLGHTDKIMTPNLACAGYLHCHNQ